MIPKAMLTTTLEQISELSTETLWEMVKDGLGFPPAESKRLKALIKQSKSQELSENEENELDDLLELQGKYALLRANTLNELQERGEDVKGYLNSK
jgi:endonuclease III-like uncharacterized protein